MKIESLRSLFVEELEDAYDFEHQIVDALPKMSKDELRRAVERA